MLTRMQWTQLGASKVGLGLFLAVLTSLTPALAASNKTKASSQKASQTSTAQAKTKAKAEPAPPVESEDPEPADEGELEASAVEAEPGPAQEAQAVEPSPGASCACAPGKNPTNTVWIEFGLRWDNGNLSRSEQVGGNRNNQNDEINSLGPLFNLGYLARQSTHVAMGAQLGYGASYDLNNNDLLIGQLLDLQYIAEFSAPLTEKFSILGAPRGGLALLIPGGILEERIDTNQEAGYDTWSGPRYGFLLGFNAGVRYKVASWFSLRATVGYSWSMLFLLDSKADGATVSASQSWQVQTSRVNGTLGAEMNF